jgi:hypothetical protein
MKLSELIKELEDYKESYGDLAVLFDKNGRPAEPHAIYSMNAFEGTSWITIEGW